MKQKMLKLLLGAALFLILLAIMPNQSTSAGSKIKLNKTKCTLEVGITKKLSISGTKKKVTWSSSNKNVATVKNGKVTAKKKGSCTITAKVGTKKYKCKITVKEKKIPIDSFNSDLDYFSEIGKLYKEELDGHGSAVLASGEIHTNRIIVGGSPDFSGFNPSKVMLSPWGEYIVQFKDSTEAQKFLDAQLKNSKVTFAEEDTYLALEPEFNDSAFSDMSLNSWGTKYIEADTMAEYILDNNLDKCIIVSVVDTGVDLDHEFLSKRISSQGIDLIEGAKNANDEIHGHGTHVSGTIVDCTKDLSVMILPIKALDKSGHGTSSTVSNGIRYAVDHGADVINLSLGGSTHSNMLDNAILYAISKGCTVVAAAGNDSTDTKNQCPAHMEDCIVVSALDTDYSKAYFSNYGASVDIAAPGTKINSSVPGNRYALYNGTSMATPHVSAAAAMVYMLHPSYTPSQVEELLKSCTEDLGTIGRDDYYGAGALKLSLALPKVLDEITIKSQPLKTSYFTGDSLNTTGLTLTAHYSNKTTETITDGFFCTPSTFTKEGLQTITVNYMGLTCTFDVNVILSTETEISVAQLPNKTTYFVGDYLDTTGLALDVLFNNGKVETITSGYSCSPDIFSKEGNQTVNVVYKGLTCSFTVVINPVVPVSLSIASNPVKLNYYNGDKIDSSGLKLLVEQSNGKTEYVTSGYEISPSVVNISGSNKQENKTITVQYMNLTTTFEVTVSSIDIKAIEISQLPSKMSYNVGDSIRSDGLILKISYTNGSTTTAANGFSCSPTLLNNAGTQKITVTYGKYTAYFNVTVTKIDKFSEWSGWSSTPISPDSNTEVETRSYPIRYNMVTICCGNSSGARCYLPYMQSGYTKRAEPYYAEFTKEQFESANVWTPGSYFTYASNVNGYIIGPGNAYCLPGGYTPYYLDHVDYETQYRYRKKLN